MQEIKYPYFKKDRILKIEMLESMRDFPRDVLEVYNETLTSGIICGFTPTVDKDIITFSKGITKYNGKVYVLQNEVSINYQETDVEVLIKLNFYDEIKNDDYKTTYVEIEIDEDTKIKSNQQEIGRFKLKSGAYLRSKYQDLYDFTTEYNTINVINILYAGYGNQTLNNELLKYFAKATLSTRTQNQMDITFSMFCLNSSRVERDTIYNYIAYKLEEELTEMTNIEIHNKLVKILDVIKKENKGLRRNRANIQKIIVD